MKLCQLVLIAAAVAGALVVYAAPIPVLHAQKRSGTADVDAVTHQVLLERDDARLDTRGGVMAKLFGGIGSKGDVASTLAGQTQSHQRVDEADDLLSDSLSTLSSSDEPSPPPSPRSTDYQQIVNAYQAGIKALQKGKAIAPPPPPAPLTERLKASGGHFGASSSRLRDSKSSESPSASSSPQDPPSEKISDTEAQVPSPSHSPRRSGEPGGGDAARHSDPSSSVDDLSKSDASSGSESSSSSGWSGPSASRNPLTAVGDRDFKKNPELHWTDASSTPGYASFQPDKVSRRRWRGRGPRTVIPEPGYANAPKSPKDRSPRPSDTSSFFDSSDSGAGSDSSWDSSHGAAQRWDEEHGLYYYGGRKAWRRGSKARYKVEKDMMANIGLVSKPEPVLPDKASKSERNELTKKSASAYSQYLQLRGQTQQAQREYLDRRRKLNETWQADTKARRSRAGNNIEQENEWKEAAKAYLASWPKVDKLFKAQQAALTTAIYPAGGAPRLTRSSSSSSSS